MSARRRVAVTLVVGAAVLLAALGTVLAQQPPRLLTSDRVLASGTLGNFEPGERVCQGAETAPAGTEAIRASVAAYIGPAVDATLTHEGSVLASGARAAGWVSSSLTLPLHPALRRTLPVTVCLQRDRGGLGATLFGGALGEAAAARAGATPLPGRMRIEYLAAGHSSWFALAGSVVRRLGLGRTPSGGWIVVPILFLMVAATAVAAMLLLRMEPRAPGAPEPLREPPPGAAR